ncbi:MULTISPECIES: hypothetical protein [unclassified Pseudomonas]|uniref:hypothetical protein n=1 Tax=unclassified Pseudomonas TaxID=196821 RepID=UPI001CBEBBFB|nr:MULTISPECIES: hypothetical protein [unclassified Pseudomonas]
MLNYKSQNLSEIFSSGRSESRSSDDLFSSVEVRAHDRHGCYWSKARDVLDFPSAIIPYNNDFEGFFADVSTFYSSYSPISAYAHIIEEDLILEGGVGASNRQSKVKSDDSIKKLSLSVGMAIGEALCAGFLARDKEPASIGYLSCKKTLSYCLARTAAIYPGYDLSKVAYKWSRMHELSGTKVSIELSRVVLWANNLLQGKYWASKDGAVVSSLEYDVSRYLNGGMREGDFVSCLEACYPGLSNYTPAFSGAYDNRIYAFNDVAKCVSQSGLGADIDAICVAFFCNAILPGSLSHSTILAKMSNEYPLALFWYGVFSSSSSKFDWRSVLSGVGQKLFRDIVAPFNFEMRPACDISIEELEVLSRLTLKASMVKPSQKRAMIVSLLPGVDLYSVIMGNDDVDEQGQSHRRSESLVKSNRIRSLLLDALKVVDEDLGGQKTDSYSRGSAKRTRKDFY